MAFGELDGRYADAQDGTRLLRVVLRPYLGNHDESVARQIAEELPAGPQRK